VITTSLDKSIDEINLKNYPKLLSFDPSADALAIFSGKHTGNLSDTEEPLAALFLFFCC